MKGDNDWISRGRTAGTLAFAETLETEGLYEYIVRSVRIENGEAALGADSNIVELLSDKTPPAAATGLNLAITGKGILIQWTSPQTLEPDSSYRIFRYTGNINAVNLTDAELIAELNPSELQQTEVIDPSPKVGYSYYTVVVADKVGNNSNPTEDGQGAIDFAAQHANFQLLPLNSITVLQENGNPPLVSWTHSGGASIIGYKVGLDADDPANNATINQTDFIDVSYTFGTARTYTVLAVDSSQEFSPARSIEFLPASIELLAEEDIKRGLMNELLFTVTNLSDTVINSAKLHVSVNGKDHKSNPVNLQPGANEVAVIVGGYSDLESEEDMTVELKWQPNAGENINITRTIPVNVTNGALLTEVFNAEIIRGQGGKVRFNLINTSETELQIITATNNGNGVSSDIRFILQDINEESTYASVDFHMPVKTDPDSPVTFVSKSNGRVVATIPAGATFESAEMDIFAPGSAPDQALLKLVIDNFYADYGEDTQVTLTGLNGRKSVSLAQTDYTAKVTSAVVNADGTVTISGQTIDRDANPLASQPVRLGVTVRGFDRIYTLVDENNNLSFELADVTTTPLTSDENGDFTATFTPPPNESGSYTAWATHPERQDKPFESDFIVSFVIEALGWNPGKHVFSMPFDFEKTFSYSFTAGTGTVATNLRLEPVSTPAGVHLTPSAPINLNGNRGTLSVLAWAEESAGETVDVTFNVVSDEKTWGQAELTLNLFVYEVDLVANMKISKNDIRTGVKFGNFAYESFNITSNGLIDINNMKFTLLNANKETLDRSDAKQSWVHLTSSPDLQALAIGDTHTVSLTFSPPAKTGQFDPIPQGYYTFYVRMESDNFQTVDFPVFATITTSDKGNYLFKVVDIYTNYTDPDTGETQLGVNEATIYIQNIAIPSLTHQLKTDELGEVLFKNLETGDWKYRASASGHESKSGTITVKPSVTPSEVVTLPNSLVTVEWSVEPVTIVDRYEIILNTTFVTNVPAAVVVPDPINITMPALKTGDTYTGEIVYTNHGYIRADDVEFTLPKSNENFKFEVLNDLPTSIGAKQKYVMTYRVTCLKSFGGDSLDPQASGGSGYETIPDGYEVGVPYYTDWQTDTTNTDCARITTEIGTGFIYTCAYGTDIKEDISVRFSTVEPTGDCSGPGGGGSGPGGGGTSSGGGGTSSGGYTGGSYTGFNFNGGTYTQPSVNIGDESICVNLAWIDGGSGVKTLGPWELIAPHHWTELKAKVDPEDEDLEYSISDFEPYNDEDKVDRPKLEIVEPNGVNPYSGAVNDSKFPIAILLAGETAGEATVVASTGPLEIETTVSVGGCGSGDCSSGSCNNPNQNSSNSNANGGMSNLTGLGSGGLSGAAASAAGNVGIETLVAPPSSFSRQGRPFTSEESSGNSWNAQPKIIGEPRMRGGRDGYTKIVTETTEDGEIVEKLRQVKTPDRVLDIVEKPTGCKVFNFYRHADVESEGSDGISNIKESASPQEKTIIRKYVSGDTYRVDVVEDDGLNLKVKSYVTTLSGQTRSTKVICGVVDGLSISEVEDLDSSQTLPIKKTEKTRKEVMVLEEGGAWSRKLALLDDNDNEVSSESKRYVTLLDGSRRTTQVTNVENGVTVTTDFAFILDENSPAYGRYDYQISSNGAFVDYTYDSQGRLIKTVRDCYGSTFGQSEDQHEVTTYTFDSVEQFEGRPSSMTMTKKGIVVNNSWIDYDGEVTTQILATRPDATKNSADNLVTVTTTYPSIKAHLHP